MKVTFKGSNDSLCGFERERERERVMQKSKTFSSKLAKFLCVFLSFVLACSLIPSQALPQVAFANPFSFFENFPTVQSEDNADSGFDVKAEWISTGSTAKITFSLSTDEVRAENNGYDILYLIDGGRTQYNFSWESQIKQNIKEIQDVSTNSRFAVLEYSDGILPQDLRKDFTKNPTIKPFTSGTHSNWTLAFEESVKFIEKREDKSRPVKVLMITGLGQPTKASAGLKQAADGLKQVAEVNVLYAGYGAVPETLKQCASSNSQTYRADDRSIKHNSAAYYFTTQVSDALDQFKRDLNNKPVEDILLEIPVEDSWEIMSSNYTNNKIEGNFGRNATSDNVAKIEADKVPSGQRIEWSFDLRFRGTKAFTLPATKEANAKFNYNGNPKNLNSSSTELTLQRITVSYDLNGGTGDTITDEKSYLPGDMIYTKQGDLLTRGSDTFAGWEIISGNATAIGESGTQYQAGTSNIVFKAQYSTVYVHADAEPAVNPSFTIKNEYGLVLPSSKIFYKTDVGSISFSNTIDNVPDGAVVWNASEDGSSGVIGWAVEDSDPSLYSITYACDGFYPSFPRDCSLLIHKFFSLKYINNLDKIDTSNVAYMKSMFYDCYSLTSLDVTNFDTSNVTDMESMFSGCSKITDLNLSGWDTSNVTDMGGEKYSYSSEEGMFSGCSSLTSLDLSNFDTSNVTNMRSMFYDCSSLTSLDLSNFDTSNVTDMGSMFYDCSSLASLDVTNFNTSNVKKMSAMFYGCSSLTSLDLSNFDTSNVTDMESMFSGCSKITDLNLSGWDTSNVEMMISMFSGCSSLASLDVTNFNTSNVTDMDGMFSGCSTLTSLDVTNFNTSNVKNMGAMFSRCSSLTSLDVTNFNTSNVKNMGGMFAWCSSLTSLDVTNFNTSNVTNMSTSDNWSGSLGMFYHCSSLTSLDVTNFNTSNVTDMDGMFSGCSTLTSLDVTNFNTSNVKKMSAMFYHCSSLTSLDVTNFNTSNVTDMDGMFSGCSTLTSLDVTNFNTSNVKKMSAMFYGCSSLTSLDVTNFDTSNVTDMRSMFAYCSKITDLNLSGWDVRKVSSMENFLTNTKLDSIDVSDWKIGNASAKDMFSSPNFTSWDLSTWDTSECTTLSSMFAGCSNITDLNLSGWNTSNVTDMESMFSGCYYLTSLDLSNFDTSNVTNMSAMFYGCYHITDLNLSGWDVRKVSSMENFLTNTKLDSIDVSDWKIGNASAKDMFSSPNFTSWDLSTWDTSECTTLSSMFAGCSNITDLNLSGWNTSNVTDMGSMFSNCSGLTSLDVTNFNTSNVTNMESMFSGCSKITNLNLSGWDVRKVSSMENFLTKTKLDSIDVSNWKIGNTVKKYPSQHTLNSVFFSSNIKSWDLSTWETSECTTLSAMFSFCSNITDLNLSGWDTSNVTDMRSMFSGCSSLTSLDVTNFNTSNVTDMRNMFQNCSNITDLSLSGWDTSNVTSVENMFYNCLKLTSLDLSGSDFSQCKTFTNMFTDALVRDKSTVLKIKNMSDYKNFTQKGMLDFVNDITVEVVDTTPVEDGEPSVNNISEAEKADVQIQTSYNDEQASNSKETESKDNSLLDDLFNSLFYLFGGNKAYAETSVPVKYKSTVEGGQIEEGANIAYSLDAMNFGTMGKIPYIEVTGHIPEGLNFVNDSFSTSVVAQKINSNDKNVPMGKLVEKPIYDASTRTVKFKVQNLSAGAYFRVTFQCSLPATPDTYTQYFMNATYKTSTGVSSTSNDVRHYAGNSASPEYNVTFKQDGDVPASAPELPNARKYIAGEKVTLPDVPTSLGYKASQWKVTKADGTTVAVQNNSFTMPAGDVAITTTWTKEEVKRYKVTYKLNGQQDVDYPAEALSLLPSDEKYLSGSTLDVPDMSNVDIMGWQFVRWSSNDTTISDNGTFSISDKDVEIVGTFQRKQFTVSFKNSDVSPGSGVIFPKARTYNWGDRVSMPAALQYSGSENWTFVGWTNNANIDTGATTFIMPKQDVEFVANWINIRMFKVTVNNGMTTQSMFEVGDTVEITAEVPTGKGLENWTVDSGNATLEDKYASQTTFEMPDGDVEVTANLRNAKYTIKFDKNGATGGDEIANIEATYDVPFDLPTNIYTRDGYTFVGWNTKADGTGTQYEAGSQISNLTDKDGDIITLYAVWNATGEVNNSSNSNSSGQNPIVATPLQLLNTGDEMQFVILFLILITATAFALRLTKKRGHRPNK